MIIQITKRYNRHRLLRELRALGVEATVTLPCNVTTVDANGIEKVVATPGEIETTDERWRLVQAILDAHKPDKTLLSHPITWFFS